jgi:PAS domain S-box-containing protein
LNSVISAGSKVRRILGSRIEESIASLYNEIRRLESKHRRLYDDSPVMHRTVNAEGRILDCNQTYAKNLGYGAKSEVIGHLIFEHSVPESLEAMQKSLEEWSATGSVRNKEISLRRRDGTVFPALINASNLYDDNGSLVGSNTVIVDITEIHRAKELLEKANQMKEHFINIAAHELRTPIQPILGIAELAKNGKVKQEEAWNTVLKEAQRLMRLANNMLDVTKIEGGFLNYNIRKTSINEVIGEVIDSARLSTKQENGPTRVKIITKLDQDAMLHIDEDRMVQALSNILNNALKFTKEGQIVVETKVTTDRKIFEIRIIDPGPGIPADVLPVIFTKFSAKTSGSEANRAGTGLGLFIAKSIIREHSGHVFAGNNQEKGATFVITLPINDAPAPQ